ncbi:hypothetical protein Taro_048386 [Colocasia esculenta]|uniref:Uncharacterized protein n=1 Tax=Colocasia esculenta TaxID=4460 RepID=A0A843X868_COLES|nr:hypothetical protein [Colocasia esculenta]
MPRGPPGTGVTLNFIKCHVHICFIFGPHHELPKFTRSCHVFVYVDI